jgi:phosphonoacetaldehyde hydrolase
MRVNPERVGRHRGPLKAVVLDWAGTILDHGSRAPVLAFVQVFARHGYTVTEAQARVPMGTAKREHLTAILAMPEVDAQVRAMQGRAPSEADVDALYAAFETAQLEVIRETSTLLPGLLEVVAGLRARGVKVGTTTGYTRAMSDACAALAAEQGFVPDARFSVTDVPQARPAPWMVFDNLRTLGVWPPSAVLKIGDTAADLAEGHAAGCWTLGLVGPGNELGLDLDAYRSLSPEERERRLSVGRQRLLDHGAHFVADDWSDVPAVIEHIERRLLEGETP